MKPKTNLNTPPRMEKTTRTAAMRANPPNAAMTTPNRNQITA